MDLAEIVRIFPSPTIEYWLEAIQRKGITRTAWRCNSRGKDCNLRDMVVETVVPPMQAMRCPVCSGDMRVAM